MANNTVAISAPTIKLNNDVIQIVPNSGTYTEGFGEASQRVASAGGDSVGLVYSENLESRKSMIKFDTYPTEEILDILADFRNNKNENAVFILLSDDVTKTVKQAAIINNYDVNLGADTTISIEIEGLPAV